MRPFWTKFQIIFITFHSVLLRNKLLENVVVLSLSCSSLFSIIYVNDKDLAWCSGCKGRRFWSGSHTFYWWKWIVGTLKLQVRGVINSTTRSYKLHLIACWMEHLSACSALFGVINCTMKSYKLHLVECQMQHFMVRKLHFLV